MAPRAFAEQPHDWQIGMVEGATPVRAAIDSFHSELVVIITGITIFVLALLVYAMVRFNAKRHPVPSQATHNTVLEVVWTAVPILILVTIAVPSFKLLYFENRAQQNETHARIIMAGYSEQGVTQRRIAAETLGSADQPQIELVLDSAEI